MKHADLLAVLAAHGVSDENLAEIRVHIYKRRAGESTECLACRCKILPGDFACGTCSAIKANRESRFWANVQDREAGGIGREIPRKPDPKRFSFITQRQVPELPLLVWEVAVDVKEKMVTADDFFTRRIVRLVEATSAEDARSRARMMTGFYPASVKQVG